MPPRSSNDMDLAAIEASIFSLVTGQGDAAFCAGDLVLSDSRAQADERLQIYASMYRSRLIEALEAEFPRLARQLGTDSFAALVMAYVQEHPSRHPSLRFLGQHLADWISRQTQLGEQQALLSDLARLEWARSDVFDGPDETALDMDTLRALPGDAFATLPLRLIAASRLIVVDARTLGLWSSLGPEMSTQPIPPTSQQGGRRVVVWRQDITVFHRPLDDAEARALDRVALGTTFGSICDGLARDLSAQDATAQAFKWLATWATDQLLVAQAAGP